jgi:hypothetical protein
MLHGESYVNPPVHTYRTTKKAQERLQKETIVELPEDGAYVRFDDDGKTNPTGGSSK